MDTTIKEGYINEGHDEHQPASLHYASDRDRCLGATGMAIAVVMRGGDKLLAAVDLDAEHDELIEYTPDFYFEGNPRLMASASWRRLVSNFNVVAAALIGNVLCRRMVGAKRMPDDDERDYLHDIIVEEGTAGCSLDPEEADALFDNNYHRLERLFRYRDVHAVAEEFASMLAHARRLSRGEVLSLLQPLSML